MIGISSASHSILEELSARMKSPKTPEVRRPDISGGSSLTDAAARLPIMKRHSFVDVTSPNDSPIAMFLLAGFTVPSEEDDGFFRSSLGITDENLLDREAESENDQNMEQDECQLIPDSDGIVPLESESLKENVPIRLVISSNNKEEIDSSCDAENDAKVSDCEDHSSLTVRMGRMRSSSIVSPAREGEGLVSPSVLQDITHLMI
jgi:hypothetical protein